jgi:hypothetical protein
MKQKKATDPSPLLISNPTEPENPLLVQAKKPTASNKKRKITEVPSRTPLPPYANAIINVGPTSSDGSTISSLSQPIIPTDQDSDLSDKKILRTLVDSLGCTHNLVRYPVVKSKTGKSRTLDRPCKICALKKEDISTTEDSTKSTKKRRAMDAGQYCYECGKSMACCNKKDRDCFSIHVQSFGS